MKIQMIGFLSIMILFISLIVYYIAKKVQRIFCCYGINIKRIYMFIAIGIIGGIIVVTSSLFAATALYMCLLFLLVDLLKLLLKKINKENKGFRFLLKIYGHGILIVIIALVLTIYSAYNAKNQQVTEYIVKIDKEMQGDLNIVMLSDIHAGTSVNEHQFDNMLDKVNELEADIILLVGDIFDESSSNEIIRYGCETFSKMQSVYGTYFITGNHDKGILNKFEDKMIDAGVKIIDDTVSLIDNKFYLVGRTDLGMEGETKRTSLNTLLEQVDDSYPIILLDHRPTKLDEVKDSIVDLQLSGHTHAGQIFPMDVFVYLFNEVVYGHKVFDDLHVIVSSGYGTWGFPIRVGSPCEIVNVILQGKN